MIRKFDSVAAIRREAIANNVIRDHESETHLITGDKLLFRNDSWYGGESSLETARKSLVGDTTLVPEAEKLISQISMQIETPRKVWERGVAGAFCAVPDALAGLPTPMRRQVHAQDDRAPLTVLAISTSSGGINAKTLLKRGTTMLAFVMAMARIRPISLHTVSILDGNADKSGETVLSTRIETAPLDIATACYALTSQGFSRRLNYNLSEKLNNFTGGWPKRFRYGSPDGGGYYDYLASALSPSTRANTLVIGAAQLHDPIVADPLRWINEQIAHFTQNSEERQYA